MPRAATAAARAKLKALASTYDPDSSDSDAKSDNAYEAGSGASAPSSVVSDDGSSSDFDPPSEEDKPARGKATPKATPRRAAGGQRGVPGGTKAKITEGTLGGRNSLGLSAAELRILNQAGGNVSRTPGRGPAGTGRVGVFPAGGPSPFISTLVWEEPYKPRAELGAGGEAMDVDGADATTANGTGTEAAENGQRQAEEVGWHDPLRARVATEPAPGRDARRERFRDLARRIGVLSPPENWEGEGWVPEMFSRARGEPGAGAAAPTTEAADSTMPGREALPPGWRWRDEVKLDVPVPEQERLSADEG